MSDDTACGVCGCKESRAEKYPAYNSDVFVHLKTCEGCGNQTWDKPEQTERQRGPK